ncbi:MAG: hypothetical protein SCM11_04175 [Bacillota bacterium]|nr:hypothetical protein [Bacillota bacterium]
MVFRMNQQHRGFAADMETNYAFKNRIFCVHKKNRRMDSIWKQIPGTIVDDSWEIIVEPKLGLVVQNAALDLADYFRVSMGVYPHVRSSGSDGKTERKIIYTVDESISGYKIETNDQILISACTDRLAAQASYAIEDIMNINEGPVMQRGVIEREPLFSPRMTHSGFELDKFPNEHLLQIAHAGMDAILVFVDGLNLSFNGYNDFNELISRANQYGLDVYAYSHMKSRYHPDDPGARSFYNGLYGNLFEACPGFKGVILVGESIEFPSKDERTQGRLFSERDPNDPRPSPGWFPCRDYPQWVEMLRDIIHEKKPEADIVFWTYNWGYCAADLRLALIDSLPADITLLVTYEMFEKRYPEPGVMMPCADYTISFIGPGHYFSTEAETAHKRGIRLYTISNTGGMTWDIGDVPYIPAPYLWGSRCASLKESQQKWNLSGLMESHHYGWTPSFVSELVKNEFWTNGPVFNVFLNQLLTRDYGAENMPDMKKMWHLMSEGFASIVATSTDQYGPLRTGPSYPLLLEQEADFPYKPYGSHAGNAPIFNVAYYYPVYISNEHDISPTPAEIPLGKQSVEQDDVRNDISLVYHIKVMMQMVSLCEEACRIFESVLDRMEGVKKQQALYTYGLCKFSLNTAVTCVNVKKWHILRCVLFGLNGEADVHHKARSKHPYPKYKLLQPGQKLDRTLLLSAVSEYLPSGPNASTDEIRAAMIMLAEYEIRNAAATLAFVTRDSRLGWEPTMEYVCDQACIQWKIAMTKDSISRIQAQ